MFLVWFGDVFDLVVFECLDVCVVECGVCDDGV